MNERISGLDRIAAGASGFLLGIGVMGYLDSKAPGIDKNPTPGLEVSNKPDEVVFQATSDTQIHKGIKAAMEVCRFKNALAEEQADGKSIVKVGCEVGTLKLQQ